MSNIEIVKLTIANKKGTFTTAELVEETGISFKKLTSIMHDLRIKGIIFRWGKTGVTPFYKNRPIGVDGAN